MKPGKEALLRMEIARMVESWAFAFDLSEDETREHLMAGLCVAWQSLNAARSIAISGAMRRDTAIDCRLRVK